MLLERLERLSLRLLSCEKEKTGNLVGSINSFCNHGKTQTFALRLKTMISRSKEVVRTPISEIQRGKAQDENGEEMTQNPCAKNFSNQAIYNIEEVNCNPVV
ncbi:hypothetical protein BGAL_0566g00010 [Botrytis galanthina]|uniref:Uncharacterized protein n=1 Tax=Botrytis galanthina TaxID=278940 RepID=A0A4S8QJM6_9HELO|nr:hypothetical protein BGAL_0566g00010 [Botrytis galanthina]